MGNITNQMIEIYKMNKCKFDFAGYYFNKREELSYHHNIIANCDGGPRTIRNGAILVRDTSHDYVHIIEKIDSEIFYKLSSEFLDENLKGRLDMENLKAIRDLLLYFEREHDHEYTKRGKLLIKREYVTDRIDIN